MEILLDPTSAGPCVLVLGMFDGVHLGHRELLGMGRRLAEKYMVPLHVMTFDPHPVAVFAPDRAPVMLSTLTERASLMADCGVQALCVKTFTREYAATPPVDFLNGLRQVYQPKAVVCGFNYTYGDRGTGDTALLKRWGDENGVEIAVVSELTVDGETVSSTRIRRLLQAGDLDAANALLAAPYRLTGCVEDGKKLGRKLGFPTANVSFPKEKALPAFGVYACALYADGERYHAVVNVGSHPTLPEGKVTVEANVLDHSIELYGKEVRLDFLWYQRPEQRFDSVEKLIAQISKDADDARLFLAEYFRTH